MAAWTASAVAHPLGCFVTVLLPVQRSGMHADLQPLSGFDEDNGGQRIDEPHRVVAFGALCFGLLCAGKLARRGTTDSVPPCGTEQ